MVRPPQYPVSEGDSLAVARAKATLKELSPEARAFVMAWLVKYYGDNGMMFSPSITQERRRVTIDGQHYWLVKLPGK
ncbi:MAG: hypothetical protein WA304_05035 [Candidatus Cybelea sp.]